MLDTRSLYEVNLERTMSSTLCWCRTDNSSNNSDEDLYPNINRLPSNILLHILKSLTMHELLCRASLVCKCWYNLCRDPDLWRNVELSHQHRVDDIVLSRLTSYSDLHTNGLKVDEDYIPELGFFLPRLRDLKGLRIMHKCG
jgi:hypothetical protein